MRIKEKHSSFLNKLLQAMMAVGGTALLAQVLVTLQSLILARWIGPEQNASVLAAFNVAGLGFILVNWGFDHWLLQRSSFDQATGHKNLGTLFSIKLLFGALIGILLLISLPNLRGEIYIPIILALALLDLLTESLCNSSYTYLLATHRFNRSSLILIVSRVLRLASTVLLVVVKVRSVPLFLGFRFLVDLGTLIYLWFILKPKIAWVNFEKIKLISQQTWTFGLAEILNFTYDRADLTLLAFLSLQKAEISYYGSAINIIIAGVGIILSLQNVLVPMIIRQEKENAIAGDNGNEKKLYAQPLALLLAVGLLGTLLLFFLGVPLINLLMGKAYQAAGPLLRLASPLILLKAGTISFSAFLIARQKQALKLVPLGIVTIIKAALIFISYKPYGLEGMIVSYIISEFILLLLYAIQLWRSRSLAGALTLVDEEQK